MTITKQTVPIRQYRPGTWKPCTNPGCERGAVLVGHAGRYLGRTSAGEAVYSVHRAPMYERCPVCRGAGRIKVGGAR